MGKLFILIGILANLLPADSREIPKNCERFDIDKVSTFYDCGGYQIFLQYTSEDDYHVKTFTYLKDGQAIPLIGSSANMGG